MSPRADGRRHTFSDIYHERTNFQFIQRSWRWGLISGLLILISLVSFGARGLNLGIDFEGGTAWQYTVKTGSPSVSAVRSIMAKDGVTDPKIVVVGGNQIRVEAPTQKAAALDKITRDLAKNGGVAVSAVSVNEVGPTWGGQVSHKALVALGWFLGLIALYLSVRFEPKMALAALLALVHDIIITVGVYSVFGFEVTPATVIAFLTILGFSLYDTVVVFDKVRENTALLGTARGETYSMVVNRSMNQVLMRSLNTSFVALLPVASLLVVGSGIMGALAIRDFAIALFVGLLVGAYSSIFVATPILAWLKEREPKNRALRERAGRAGTPARTATAPVPAAVAAPRAPAGRSSQGRSSQGRSPQAPVPAATVVAGAPAGADEPQVAEVEVEVEVGTMPPTPARAIPPRPRKTTKPKRKR
ncbi:MAG: protein-export rane protein SecF [Actinomycetia bacterium]|nr:protein-export rane protein SecF [Actinomycetes bacterium]